MNNRFHKVSSTIKDTYPDDRFEILVAEWRPDVEAEVYRFENISELIKFRSHSPEIMKMKYQYALVDNSQQGKNGYIVLSESHYKRFKKSVMKFNANK
ncbi:hypothetical protein KAM448_45080 [Aeromonas caviae]|uniref:KTSC domain-containing protein n=2 Tax=Aeromonas caviae TaxID=648 RepID=A0ABD0BDP9_AERCA|nr:MULTISPECIES: hypothetical protein [Aeromonas]BCK65807.1 hypothetical protein KAM330_47960 [Aeromonas hydrophila]BCR31399.1 hypothetical protein KAM376_44050 [Aeromonas caviae]GJB01034.1 hypothetical protein KAM359_44410 [Aeromonas caviae]GJB13966.1 hypothetical protein KAM362_45260 [Aeromonas caviae]GJB35404.1 hypothetical protein KAM367_45060 [Aeromonas caviae]